MLIRKNKKQLMNKRKKEVGRPAYFAVPPPQILVTNNNKTKIFYLVWTLAKKCGMCCVAETQAPFVATQSYGKGED